jgi:hypothetical protein
MEALQDKRGEQKDKEMHPSGRRNVPLWVNGVNEQRVTSVSLKSHKLGFFTQNFESARQAFRWCENSWPAPLALHCIITFFASHAGHIYGAVV